MNDDEAHQEARKARDKVVRAETALHPNHTEYVGGSMMSGDGKWIVSGNCNICCGWSLLEEEFDDQPN